METKLIQTKSGTIEIQCQLPDGNISEIELQRALDELKTRRMYEGRKIRMHSKEVQGRNRKMQKDVAELLFILDTEFAEQRKGFESQGFEEEKAKEMARIPVRIIMIDYLLILSLQRKRKRYMARFNQAGTNQDKMRKKILRINEQIGENRAPYAIRELEHIPMLIDVVVPLVERKYQIEIL